MLFISTVDQPIETVTIQVLDCRQQLHLPRPVGRGGEGGDYICRVVVRLGEAEWEGKRKPAVLACSPRLSGELVA